MDLNIKQNFIPETLLDTFLKSEKFNEVSQFILSILNLDDKPEITQFNIVSTPHSGFTLKDQEYNHLGSIPSFLVEKEAEHLLNRKTWRFFLQKENTFSNYETALAQLTMSLSHFLNEKVCDISYEKISKLSLNIIFTIIENNKD